MEILIQILFERKWVSAAVADKAKAQFHNYVLEQAGYKCSQVLTGTRNV